MSKRLPRDLYQHDSNSSWPLLLWSRIYDVCINTEKKCEIGRQSRINIVEILWSFISDGTPNSLVAPNFNWRDKNALDLKEWSINHFSR